VSDNEIRLTLLRAPMMPDMYADRGLQEVTYSFCPFTGAFNESDVLHQATELNEGVILGGSNLDCGPVFLSDRKNIVVKGEDEKIETGMRKIGAMLGDWTEIGCGSVLNPGSVIGAHTNVYPLSSVRGVVPANSIYKREGEIVEKRAE
jgi:acetyltransferase-like isoleucine patch superfamily enzyme